ncbi:MAG: DUF4160 domain-containing protein [Candidatus Omnitrophica bacterium]|nr:DUF4160 domain-containing protein [Candidatus Omnitrophota bacterium]
MHVCTSDGEAKFWIFPVVAHAHSKGLTVKQINAAQKIVEERKNEIAKSWKKHFSR